MSEISISELLDKTEKERTQVITRHGVETAVAILIEEWKRLSAPARPSLKYILLAPHPRFDLDALLATLRGFIQSFPPFEGA